MEGAERNMSTTSLGSVTLGLVLLFGGIASVVVGGILVDSYGIASASGSQESSGFLFWGSSEQSGSASVSAMGVFGLLLAAGGILATLAGVIVTALSFERGKDREMKQE
jgi:hypothetical protein